MNVVVCIKQVPGTTEVKIDAKTNTLSRQGVKAIINPFDMYAVEEGIRLKERFGGKVTVLTMGPPQAEEALKETLSLGVDDVILLTDRLFAGSDTLATAYALSKAVAKIGSCDLVICGKQTFDGDTGQVGPELAQRLGLPFVAYVSKVEEVANGRMKVQRMVEDGHEQIDMPLPGVITVVKEINVPRMPSLRGLSKSKSYKIPHWTAAELGINEKEVGLAGSPTRVVKVFYPQRVQKAEIFKGSPEEQVAQLLDKLQEAKLI